MAGKITIDIERCKGCGLCVAVCPKNAISISDRSNKAGYFPAQPVNDSDSLDKLATGCTGCAMCAIVCPEAIIEVYRDDDTGDESKKSKPSLIKEKA
jgi:2-oxoglutarate ferredoxin oxidoreductase subunit delta